MLDISELRHQSSAKHNYGPKDQMTETAPKFEELYLHPHTKWQSIDTAPEDVPLLVYSPWEDDLISANGGCHIAWLIDGVWRCDMTNKPLVDQPSHWLPLPEDP
jgi:hypothetical protein